MGSTAAVAAVSGLGLQRFCPTPAPYRSVNDLTHCEGENHQRDQAEEDKFQANREPDPADGDPGPAAAGITVSGVGL